MWFPGTNPPAEMMELVLVPPSSSDVINDPSGPNNNNTVSTLSEVSDRFTLSAAAALKLTKTPLVRCPEIGFGQSVQSLPTTLSVTVVA